MEVVTGPHHPPPPENGGTTKEHPKVSELRQLMNKNTKVYIQDGRLFCGRLACFDKQKNVLLNECEETRPASGNNKEEKRLLGSIMIPHTYITQIYVDKNDVPPDPFGLSPSSSPSPDPSSLSHPPLPSSDATHPPPSTDATQPPEHHSNVSSSANTS